MASLLCSLALLVLFLNLASDRVAAEHHVLEDGYTVTTVIDGNKLRIIPYAILPHPGSSDLIVLDSSSSSFYLLPFPTSQDTVVKPLSGGEAGYSDGDLGSARFKNPKNFAVDLKGNIYVADKANNVIRKISNSGVTTIAGGLSQKPGKGDGPAQNASFSSDFELVFVAKECALLIPDHGSNLVRRIDLRPDDCAIDSQSSAGVASVWTIGLGLSCLVGIAIGIAIRPYIFRHEHIPRQFRGTWKHYLINLVRQVPRLCFAIRSEIASFKLTFLNRLFQMSLYHVSLMFRFITVGSQISNKDIVSLLDSDVNSCEVEKSQICADPMKDLIDLNDNMQLSNYENELLSHEESDNKESDVILDGQERVDDIIECNLKEFAMQAKGTTPMDGSVVRFTGLIKRR